MPLVSVLVPVYNRVDLLVPCLDSALAQTMPDLEVVVVDGASTDGTWEVCQRYAAADRRVRVFQTATNTGPVRGWWECLSKATGSYATFLWSDDLWQPDFLAATLAALSSPDVAFAFSAAEIGPMPGAGEVQYAQQDGLIASRDFIEGSLRGDDRYPVSPACALFRSSDLRESFRLSLPAEPEIDLTATGAGTDLLLFLLTATRYSDVACLSKPLAFFRTHPGSLTVDGRGGQVSLGYALTKSWFARTHGYERLVGRIVAQHWLQQMRASGHPVNPFRAARTYGKGVGAAGLIVAALGVLARRAAHVSAAAPRRAGSPSPTA